MRREDHRGLGRRREEWSDVRLPALHQPATLQPWASPLPPRRSAYSGRPNPWPQQASESGYSEASYTSGYSEGASEEESEPRGESGSEYGSESESESGSEGDGR